MIRKWGNSLHIMQTYDVKSNRASPPILLDTSLSIFRAYRSVACSLSTHPQVRAISESLPVGHHVDEMLSLAQTFQFIYKLSSKSLIEDTKNWEESS